MDTTATVVVTDADGESTTDDITLDLNPTNENPILSNLDQTVSFTEDDSSADITDIVITELDTIQESTDTTVGNDDVSAETVSVTVTLSDANAGSLTASGGSVYTSSTGEWYLAATSVTDANKTLSQMDLLLLQIMTWMQQLL